MQVSWRTHSEKCLIFGYIEALLFADTGLDSDIPADAEFSPDALQAISEHCSEFLRANETLLNEAAQRGDYQMSNAGIDLYFTEHGHGVGYWDRDVLDDGGLGDKLTDAARAIGALEFYQGDDGLIYC